MHRTQELSHPQKQALFKRFSLVYPNHVEQVREVVETATTSDDEVIKAAILDLISQHYRHPLEYKEDFLLEQNFHVSVMLMYKTMRCISCDNPAKCLFTHDTGTKIRRKPVRGQKGTWNYQPQMCRNLPHCDDADCPKAHSEDEVRFHPMVYKTQDCKDNCQQKLCPYAHDSSDRREPSKPKITPSRSLVPRTIPKESLRIYTKPEAQPCFDPTDFKTQECTNTSRHSKLTCLFYHGLEDKRRPLNRFPYGEKPCFAAFDPRSKVFNSLACPQGDDCLSAHSKVEVIYHPAHYKKNKCLKDPCDLGLVCPYRHPNEETDSILIAADFPEVHESAAPKMTAVDIQLRLLLLKEEVKALEYQTERAEAFRCQLCRTQESTVTYHCGHLYCSACSQADWCSVCRATSTMITLQLT